MKTPETICHKCHKCQICQKEIGEFDFFWWTNIERVSSLLESEVVNVKVCDSHFRELCNSGNICVSEFDLPEITNTAWT